MTTTQSQAMDAAARRLASTVAEIRQGQNATPRYEPPSEYDVDIAYQWTRRVLEAQALRAYPIKNEAALADSELVDRLRARCSYGDARLWQKHDPLSAQAADRIAALSAEVERLARERDEARTAWKEAITLYEQEAARVDPALAQVAVLTKQLDEAAKVIGPFAAFDETGILYADGAPVVVKSEGILDLTMTLGHFRAARSWQASRGEGAEQ